MTSCAPARISGRGAPVGAVLALLLYGLGLGMLANMLPKEREHGDDWRVAA